MKRCIHCNTEIENNANFCASCGKSTRNSVNKKKSTVACFVIVILTLIFLLGDVYSQHKSRADLEEEQLNRRIEEYKNTPQKSDITFKDDWDMRTKNDYIYVEGSITNTGKNPIKYYKITVNFYASNGEMIDSDWTNGTDLGVGETQIVDLMHKDNSGYIWKFDYQVTEVR